MCGWQLKDWLGLVELGGAGNDQGADLRLAQQAAI